MRPVQFLFSHIERGEMDPSHLLTHLMPLGLGLRGYNLFKNKKEGCDWAVFTPSRRSHD